MLHSVYSESSHIMDERFNKDNTETKFQQGTGEKNKTCLFCSYNKATEYVSQLHSSLVTLWKHWESVHLSPALTAG